MQSIPSPPSSFELFEPISAELHEVEARMRHIPEGAHPNLTDALQYVLDAGGKRVRPGVTLLTGKALGADSRRLIDLAAATELLHTATLVHDDIIDGSLLRRGVSTLNAAWSPGATILTGDFIFARAAQLAAATANIGVIEMFAETLMTIVNGELQQLFEGRNGQRERSAYFYRIQAKTASLFALASGAAALLASKSDEEVRATRAFGNSLGMAFQIVDDILDFIGQERAVGKPLGSDLRQGLATLPTLYYLELHPNDTRVPAILDGRQRNPEIIEAVIVAICDSSAVSMAFGEAREFVEQAKSDLKWMPDSSERRALAALADYVVDRDI